MSLKVDSEVSNHVLFPLCFASYMRFKMCALSCRRNPRCVHSAVMAIISDTLDSCKHKPNKPFLLQAALVLVFHHGVDPKILCISAVSE